jgi:beta-N-acetylhexosaminidase
MNKHLWAIFLILFFLISPCSSSISVGKLIITGFHGTHPSDPSVVQLKRHIEQGMVGGVILFKRNIINKSQLKTLISYLKKETPIFVAIDHEGGLVNRLTHDSFQLSTPSPAQFCKSSPNGQRHVANQVAALLKEIGINLNLGGIMDIQPLIYASSICDDFRCYSDRATTVANCAGIMYAAHQEHGILWALKHFPGHGSTAIDSHHDLPNISLNHSDYDLLPYHLFFRTYSVDTHMVMMGHLRVDAIDPHRPASVSKSHIDRLKHQLNYTGFIITDDLNMRALTQIMVSPLDRAKNAIFAGNDLILFGNLSSKKQTILNRQLHQTMAESPAFHDAVTQSLKKINRYWRTHDH